MTTQTQSRTARRLGTKSEMHKVCQRRTKQAIRRAKKEFYVSTGHKRTGRAMVRPMLTYLVVNKRTKREATVSAFDVDGALALAISEHRLAKKVDNLTATLAE